MKKAISFILCIALFIGIMPMSFAARDTSFEETLAQDLKQLGLFYGVSYTDFDLDREPTRIEALVMLIRVLGAEKAALSGTWSHPFTDVPAWADKYVGYGYEHGLANGVGLTKFGTGRANAAMYLTFVLRALGYSDIEGDFVWDNPFALASKIGILTNRVDTASFWRADVVLVSYAALGVPVKSGGATLAQNLIKAGVFTQAQFDTYYDANALAQKANEKQAKDAEQIFAECGDAVFYIEVYDKSGNPLGSGSGFFIDANGTAVTNYHVIEGASYAKIQLSDEKSVYSVKGVINYSAEQDWAVIKVDGSGFKYLEMGDTSSIVSGAKIFAIGCPLGLQNTISEGIISNPKRVFGASQYFQITAPISGGSSGGAIIDAYGKVIGISSAGFEEGQNLNLAVPVSLINVSGSENGMSLDVLNIMEGGSPEARQQAAFDALASFIMRNSNYDLDGTPAYSTTRPSSNGIEMDLILYYEEAYNYIGILGAASEEDYSSFNMSAVVTSISPDLQRSTVTYNYESETYYTSTFEGNSSIKASEVYDGFPLEFSDYDSSDSYISSSDVAAHEEIASMLVVVSMMWTDTIMAEATGNEYRMEDFGFVNLYK